MWKCYKFLACDEPFGNEILIERVNFKRRELPLYNQVLEIYFSAVSYFQIFHILVLFLAKFLST
jgi:hypothetical protein